MFNPTRDQTRRFLLDAWHKRRQRLPATPLESLAADLVEIHPEYQALFERADALEREWTPEDGQTNPFLHLSLHLAIEEQLAIDQPPGICAALAALSLRMDRHDALHRLLECLGEVMWRAQRDGKMPDSDYYLDLLRRAASQ